MPSKPSFSKASGSYTGAIEVSLTDAAKGATIYYTTNGGTPGPSSTRYTGPIPVAATASIKAVAVAAGGRVSPVAEAIYTIR